LIFFFPETQYYRKAPLEPASPISEGKESATVAVQEHTIAVQEHNPIPPKKSFLQELKPWSTINPGIEKGTSIIYLFLRPWPLVAYPAVIYSFLVFSCNLACVVNVLNTAAVVFQSPPYNMSPGIQSLIYVAPLVTGALGSYCGGGLTDIIIQWRARKNNGIFEPEDRLLAVFIPLFIVPAGELMYQ
jgi:hypothetical protein